MTLPILLRFVLVATCCVLVACQAQRRADPIVLAAGDWRGAVAGEFDNHEQVSQARAAKPPHVSFVVSSLGEAGWYAWRTRLRSDSVLEATWVLHAEAAGDGRIVLTPYRPLIANAAIDRTFDARQWVELAACALRGSVASGALFVQADPASCATVAPGIGVEAAVLPLSIEQRGDMLRVRLYADQARGVDARAEARRVRWFSGWAALNGAGEKATADSSDWHMAKDLRVGSEGGRAALAWRDGKPSGYSVLLERLTYRDGNVPVLKLSVVEDASSRTLVYAWANPEATSIGLNLGWVQVGLSRDPAATTASAPRN